MIHVPDINLAATGALPCRLGMAAQTHVRVALSQQLRVDRPVRVVADRAAFAQRPMLENHWLGLFAMALSTTFVEPRHGQTIRGLEDVAPMRIMALRAIHFLLQHRMMLRQMEFGLGRAMAFEAGRRIFAGIEDQFAPASATRDMQASCSVARLAAGLSDIPGRFEVNARVGADRKNARNIRVALGARLIAHEARARNLRRRLDASRDRRTGIEQQNSTGPDDKACA